MQQTAAQASGIQEMKLTNFGIACRLIAKVSTFKKFFPNISPKFTLRAPETGGKPKKLAAGLAIK